MQLDLLKNSSSLKINYVDQKSTIWDLIRSKWVSLTPEEMVRQCLLIYLIDEKKISKNRIAVEKEIILGSKKKRFDVLVFDEELSPHISIECKSPDIRLDEKVVSQIVRYNQVLNSKYLWVVNGIDWIGFEKSVVGNWIRNEDLINI